MANASKSEGSTSDPASVGGSPTNVRATTSANPTLVEKTVRSQDTVSDSQGPDQLNESWYSRSELPLDFKFSDPIPSTCKVKVGDPSGDYETRHMAPSGQSTPEWSLLF